MNGLTFDGEVSFEHPADCPVYPVLDPDAVCTLECRMIGRRHKVVSLAINRDFDTRWIGELPIVFDGSAEACAKYAFALGYRWIADDRALFGGRWEHPGENWILYPV